MNFFQNNTLRLNSAVSDLISNCPNEVRQVLPAEYIQYFGQSVISQYSGKKSYADIKQLYIKSLRVKAELLSGDELYDSISMALNNNVDDVTIFNSYSPLILCYVKDGLLKGVQLNIQDLIHIEPSNLSILSMQIEQSILNYIISRKIYQSNSFTKIDLINFEINVPEEHTCYTVPFAYEDVKQFKLYRTVHVPVFNMLKGIYPDGKVFHRLSIVEQNAIYESIIKLIEHKLKTESEDENYVMLLNNYKVFVNSYFQSLNR